MNYHDWNYFKGAVLRKGPKPAKATWSGDQEHELRDMLSKAGLSPTEIDQEVKLRKSMAERYSVPVPAAEKREGLLQEAYEAKRPGHQRVFLEAAKKAWT